MHVEFVFSPYCSFKVLSLSFDSLAMMSLDMDLPLLILLVVFQDSCKYRFIKFGEFSAILSSNIISALSDSLFFFWNFHIRVSIRLLSFW